MYSIGGLWRRSYLSPRMKHSRVHCMSVALFRSWCTYFHDNMVSTTFSQTIQTHGRPCSLSKITHFEMMRLSADFQESRCPKSQSGCVARLLNWCESCRSTIEDVHTRYSSITIAQYDPCFCLFFHTNNFRSLVHNQIMSFLRCQTARTDRQSPSLRCQWLHQLQPKFRFRLHSLSERLR